jgi:Carbohydrate esterase, sialic acid-specific acetylesterase
VWDQYPQGAHGVPKLEDRKKWQEDKDAASGVMYRAMIEHVKKVLADPKQVCPEYDEKAGYELAGFVWFQGFNDLVDRQTYPNGNFDEYSRLLSHFIRDVRKDLSAPKMPFVIGVLGVDGEKNVNLRKAMAAPADMPEFKGNVVAVDTAPFWDHDIEASIAKQGAYNNILATAYTLKKEAPRQNLWVKMPVRTGLCPEPRGFGRHGTGMLMLSFGCACAASLDAPSSGMNESEKSSLQPP